MSNIALSTLYESNQVILTPTPVADKETEAQRGYMICLQRKPKSYYLVQKHILSNRENQDCILNVPNAGY